MKKIDKEAMEKFAKEKNIDKSKIEEIANGYKDKSEDELLTELIKIGKNLKGKEEVVEKIKTFLDENQRKKIDTIMSKVYAAESQDKLNKKSKKSKSSNKESKIPTQNKSNKKTTKSTKTGNSENPNNDNPIKKIKKIKKHEE